MDSEIGVSAEVALLAGLPAFNCLCCLLQRRFKLFNTSLPFGRCRGIEAVPDDVNIAQGAKIRTLPTHLFDRVAPRAVGPFGNSPVAANSALRRGAQGKFNAFNASVHDRASQAWLLPAPVADSMRSIYSRTASTV